MLTNTQTQAESQELKTRILKWASKIKSWGIPWETGIYPGEMAAFLGLCDLYSARTIIESGRGEHAYSTQVLGEYAELTGTDIASIDLSPPQRTASWDRLKNYSKLRCVAGDTFCVLPDVARAFPSGPIALLLDGPKMQQANRLSLAASVAFDVRVIAHHNCPLSSPWGKEFARVFPGAFHYEDLGLSEIVEWQDFKRWETEWVHGYQTYDQTHGLPGRALDASSLALVHLPTDLRSKKRLLRLQRGPLRYHPLILWTKWLLRRSGTSPAKSTSS